MKTIDKNDVKIVFHDDWYDGYLSGHCWYMQKYCYFSLNNNGDVYTNRLFDVYELKGNNLLHALAMRQCWSDVMGSDVSKDNIVIEGGHQFWMEKFDNCFSNYVKNPEDFLGQWKE